MVNAALGTGGWARILMSGMTQGHMWPVVRSPRWSRFMRSHRGGRVPALVGCGPGRLGYLVLSGSRAAGAGTGGGAAGAVRLGMARPAAAQMGERLLM